MILNKDYIDEITSKDYKDIVELDFTESKIVSIHVDTFDNIPLLERLFLDNNQLDELNKDVFRNLKKLTALDLSNNRLSLIDKHLFKPLAHLNTLNLDNN